MVVKHGSLIQTIPFNIVCSIIEVVSLPCLSFPNKCLCYGPNPTPFQVHLESFPRCAAHLVSSCRDLWNSSSLIAINLQTMQMLDFALWPLLSKSIHYHIKGVHLDLSQSPLSSMAHLPPELSQCAFLHTLDLRGWRRLENASRCIYGRVICKKF